MRRAKIFRFAGPMLLALLLGLAFVGADLEMLDSFNIAAPVWLPICALYLGGKIWAAARARRWANLIAPAALSLGYAALALLLFRPLWDGASAPARRGEPFRVISFNLYKDNPEAHAAARWIAGQAPDFVILVEASKRAAKVADLLEADYPHRYDCQGNGDCSTMILSRTPALSVEHHARGDTENRRALSAMTVRFRRGERALDITAVHLKRPWPFARQSFDFAQLSALVGRRDGHHIVAGDFNNVPWTFAMNRMAYDLDVRLASGGMRSWPSPNGPVLPLDNIYVGSCVVSPEVERGPSLGSDHYPLVMDARLADCDD